MKRCKSCLTKAESETGQCPVCGIRQDKKRNELSPAEKRVRYFARCILGVAAIHVVGLVLCLYVLLVLNPQAAAKGEFVFAPAILATLAITNLILAIGLARYAFWAYKVATAYYFLLGIVNIVSVQIAGILLMLILLYFIGNGTAKAIFERRALAPVA
ncbi:MAG: hypothetical protein K9M54_05960 [Kiritimatiellales bacterium]|nr:hypothetical protein [Kiritimatiellales bacterium]MCF7864239.1 hypothetical protein [Kiritimatiellales bacterium]